MARARIGVSGWSYKAWAGDFYPEGLPRSRQLEHVASRFDTVEVNGSFYQLQTPRTYRAWYDATPAGFRFAVKGSRFITHNKKLRDVDAALGNFFASGVLALEDKLGPFLWQLPARHVFDADRLTAFLARLPKNRDEAVALASGHDDRVPEPHVGMESRVRIRHALEVRHPSFFTDEAVRVVRDAGVALVVSDAGGWPRREEPTAGFVFVRLHGNPHTYHSRYEDDALDAWAAKIGAWLGGCVPEGAERITGRTPPRRKGWDVYVYFDNDAAGHAPFDALRLRERLEGRGR